MEDNLQQITNNLNNHPDYWAKLITARHDPVQRDDYLILFARRQSDVLEQLVLMGDYSSITWRPFKAQDTPCYCNIDIINVETATKHMMLLADAWHARQLPPGADEGEGAGEHLLKDNP